MPATGPLFEPLESEKFPRKGFTVLVLKFMVQNDPVKD